jgi:hypothetical protein
MNLLIENTGTTIETTKKEIQESFKGIINQLDYSEIKEIIDFITGNMSKVQISSLLNYCCENFPTQTSISLEENGLIEEE